MLHVVFSSQYETSMACEKSGGLQSVSEDGEAPPADENLSPGQPVAYHMVNRRYSEFLNLQTRLEEKAELRRLIKGEGVFVCSESEHLIPRLVLILYTGWFQGSKVRRKCSQRCPLGTWTVRGSRPGKASWRLSWRFAPSWFHVVGWLDHWSDCCLLGSSQHLCAMPEIANSEEMQEFLALNTDARIAFVKKPFIVSRIDKVWPENAPAVWEGLPHWRAQTSVCRWWWAPLWTRWRRPFLVLSRRAPQRTTMERWTEGRCVQTKGAGLTSYSSKDSRVLYRHFITGMKWNVRLWSQQEIEDLSMWYTNVYCSDCVITEYLLL